MKPAPIIPLEGRYYQDPEILAREWERIFHPSWLLAGRAAEAGAPGAYFTVAIGPESILVVRGRDRRLRAFHNLCRHRGSRLCDAGQGRFPGAIVCPYHGWSYALDGSLRAAPKVGPDHAVSAAAPSLYPVEAANWEGFVFVRLEGGGEDLAAQLGVQAERVRPYPLAGLRVGARHEREVAANWKILVENFAECYHCPGVHPELADFVPFYRTGEVDDTGDEPPEFREGVVTATASGTTRRPLFPALRGRPRQRYHADLVLPNLFLYLFPDYVCARTLWPLAPGRTRVISEWLFEPGVLDGDAGDIDDAVQFLDHLGEQDWQVCERVQQGVASRAYTGGFLLEQEAGVAEFDRWYLERMETTVAERDAPASGKRTQASAAAARRRG